MLLCKYPRLTYLLAGAALATQIACEDASALQGARFDPEPVPDVVTEDIAAGIEAHIRKKTEEDGGTFRILHEGKELRMKLVRVHLEYLANLGPRRHFACVDLANEDGNVFDVDFFLSGDPGDMTVTETTVHKLNGQPYYLWKQERDGTWKRVAVTEADNALLGIVEGADRFEFVYQFKLPEINGPAKVWLPVPQSDAYQTVEMKQVRLPGEVRTVRDARYGNTVIVLTLGAEDSGKSGVMKYVVERHEKGAYPNNGPAPDTFLAAEALVPVTDDFRAIAVDVLKGKEGELVRARALYDHTLDKMKYMKFGAGYGQGNAQRACDAASGNCTDYHSYFIALCRASGIPARFAIGASIPSDRDSGGIDGYHCWAEFYADGKWWPVDISEADKYTPLSTYYFGRHPANRIELSRGRDLVVEPGPASGPINYLAFPVMEAGGEVTTLRPQFSFKRIK